MTPDAAAPLLPDDASADVDGDGGHANRPPAEEPVVLVQQPAKAISDFPAHTLERARMRGRAWRLAAIARSTTRTARWNADMGHRRGFLGRLRRTVLSGSVTVVAPERQPSVLDTVIAAQGLIRVSKPRVGSGGGMSVQVRGAEAGNQILRLGRSDTPADPSRHHEGLLAVAGWRGAPRPIASGRRGAVVWSLESKLEGRMLDRLTTAVVEEVDAILRELPKASDIAAPFDAVKTLSALLPEAEELDLIAPGLADRLDGLPGVLIHGDVWAGNLLIDRSGRVAGIVDWDAWQPKGAPMTDLMHLLADGVRRRSAGGYGDLFRGRFWRTPHYRELLACHLEGTGIEPSGRSIDGLAVAWWVTAIAAALLRNPRVATPRWVQANVLAPTETASRLLA